MFITFYNFNKNKNNNNQNVLKQKFVYLLGM